MSSNTTKSLITQVKLDLKKVIENLRLLEKPDNLDDKNLKDLKKETQLLLKNIESKPLEKLKCKTKKQKIKRQHKKLLRLKKIGASKEIPDSKGKNTTGIVLESKTTLPDIPRSRQATKKNYQHHLRSLKESHRFLKTFELLEQLHLARGQDPSETRKFSQKLQHLKTVWNTLLQEKQSEQFDEEEQIQQQWNQLLFGATEKSYMDEKPNIKYFLRKRHIWDSFIDNKHGSSIPVGWVLPPRNPNKEWSQYLVKE